MFKNPYPEKLSGKRIITVHHEFRGGSNDWWFVSQHTGELHPITIKGFVAVIKATYF